MYAIRSYYEHVVATPGDAVDAAMGAPAGALPRKDTGEILGPVTEDRHALALRNNFV